MITNINSEGDTWIMLINKYIKTDELPEDRVEARRL